MTEKKMILDIVREVEGIFIKEKLSAREILLILRELETNANIVLVLGQLAINEISTDIKGQGQA